MVSTESQNLVHDVRLSSVVPASITGEDKVHELRNMDLVLKLHYLKGVYFFSSDAAQGLTIHDLKKSMFLCLDLHYPLSGRIRRSENGKPFIKCNDSGVRTVEAKCTKTLDEWLAFNDSSLNDQLIYCHFLGPDLGFTPLVFVQFTWFKCGGISIGLSWAHILGDAFSASNFINIWAKFLTDQMQPLQHEMPSTRVYSYNKNKPLCPVSEVPLSLQRVLLDPVGDQWIVSNNCKMQYHSFHLTAKQLNHLNQVAKLVKPFEVISAVFWKSLAKIRGKSSEPKIVTICSKNIESCHKENELPSNSQVSISTVEAANLKVPIADAELAELANLIAHKQVDETSLIEEVMDQKDYNEGKVHDFILYGANLTFVNLEEVKIYGPELRGQKPVFASYSLNGVGDQGAILVLPGPASGGKEQGERLVNLVLPENQLEELKHELRKEWGIF